MSEKVWTSISLSTADALFISKEGKLRKVEEADKKIWTTNSELEPTAIIAGLFCPCFVVFNNFKAAGKPEEGKRFAYLVGIMYFIPWFARLIMDCYFSKSCTPRQMEEYHHDQVHRRNVLENKWARVTEIILIISVISFMGSLLLQRVRLGMILGIAYGESAKAFLPMCCMCYPCVLAHEEAVVQDHVWVVQPMVKTEPV